MNKFIAYCGLNCEACDAYKATKNNDDELRSKTAKLWSELNNVDIRPEMINCEGCKMDGAKTYYCDVLCPIRQCAMGRNYETCGDCGEWETCEKVAVELRNNEDALRNLRK